MTMDDLVQFLRARLDEQEARARALPAGPWQWRTVEDEPQYDELVGPTEESILASSDTENYCSWISRHDAYDAYLQDIQPERMLAEIDAKRRLIEEQVSADEAAQFPDYDGGRSAGLDDALRFIALPYAGHPDYREEWRPL